MENINKNFELNFECKICGCGIFNATEELKTCTECGGSLQSKAALNSRSRLMCTHGLCTAECPVCKGR